MNVALAIVLDQRKVLVSKIKPEKLSEYGGLSYVFPCESVQNKGSAEEELIKEVKKQTNLDIEVVHKIGERIHPSTQNYTYYFHCKKYPEQTVTAANDIDVESFIWLDVDELQTYMPTMFDDVKVYLNENR
jgi:hypothetical protein